MATPYLSEIRIMTFNFAPKGWALFNGQPLPINQNQALFSLLGTTYGGDGRTTFGLPNLQGRVPVHRGNGFVQGQAGGEQTHTLVVGEEPVHTHTAVGTVSAGDAPIPAGNYLGAADNLYAPLANPTTLHPSTISNAGGSQPHENMRLRLLLPRRRGTTTVGRAGALCARPAAARATSSSLWAYDRCSRRSPLHGDPPPTGW